MKFATLIDQPLDSIENEALGMSDYAHVLGSFIKSSETPLTIGIQGDWGIGKTSLLNLIKGNLEANSSKCQIIYLNTWQFAQFNRESLLSIVVLKGLMDSLEDLFQESMHHQVRKRLKGLGSFLTSVGDQLLQNQTGVSAAAALSATQGDSLLSGDVSKALQDYRSQFEQLIDDLLGDDGSKLVVMIDDLDRIKPVRALELLESMKIFLDVPRCVFLLAVDYSVIQRGVREKLGATTQELHGKSFFDKIIQIPFNMPVDSYQVDRYIMSLLGSEFRNGQVQSPNGEGYFLPRSGSISDEDVAYFTNVTRTTVGNNPRSIKRAVNYANLMRLVLTQMRSKSPSNERWKLGDARILYALSCLQLAWPELFSYFAKAPAPNTISHLQDWEFLEKLSSAQPLFKRSHDPKMLMNNIGAFFDELINLVDKDGNGKIDYEEFKPIWKIMNEANMTSVRLADHDMQWKSFRANVKRQAQASNDPRWNEERIDGFIKNFTNENSRWSDPGRFQLLPAGKRYFNILWDDHQVGSIATTQSEPVQLFLKLDPMDIMEKIQADCLRDYRSQGHYGTGDLKIDVQSLERLTRPQAVELLNRLHLEITEKPRLAEPSPIQTLEDEFTTEY